MLVDDTPFELESHESRTFNPHYAQDTVSRVQALLAKCSAERDQALRLFNARTVELQTTQKELSQLKEQFEALQKAFQQSIGALPSGDPKSTDCIVSLEGCTLSSQPPQELEGTPYSAPPPRSEPPHSTQPGALDRLACLEGCTLSPQPNQQKSGVVHTTLPVALPTPPQSPSRQESRLPSAPNVKTGTIGAAAAGALSGDKAGAASPNGDSPTTALYHDVRSIADLRVLIGDAANGQAQSSARLEWFHKKAKETPLDERTLPEEYVVLEWGKTIKAFKSPTSPPTTPLSCPKSFESEGIFVDASYWGIGFVYKGRWLAWPLKEGWRTEGRDINWSEMVAVELGLHVAISAGLTHRKVIIKSDSTSVIHALTTGGSRHPQYPEVIKRISALIQKHDIVLDISWVPTSDNLADGPSRGKFPPKELLFPGSFPVPQYLASFICPATRPTPDILMR